MAKLITRRRFFTGAGATLAGTCIYVFRIEPHRVTTVSRDLPLANLTKDLDGKILVQISDLHIGPTGNDYLRSCFRLDEGLNPELIVITGDFMTSRGTEEIAHVGSLISELKPAPLGITQPFGTKTESVLFSFLPSYRRLHNARARESGCATASR